MTLVIEEPIAQAIIETAASTRRTHSQQVNYWLSQAVEARGSE